MKNVMVIMSNKVEEFEAIGTIDILRRAKINVDVYSLNGSDVLAAKGTTISNLLDLNDVDINKYDLLFIPGGPHYQELRGNNKVISIIKDFYNKKKFIAAICAAPTILGDLGYLKNKNYTCFKSMNKEFGGNYKYQYSVIDLPLITGISVAGTVDFALDIVKVLEGEDVCNSVKESIYY